MSEKKQLYCLIPQQTRLFMLFQFCRTHPKDKIVVLCYGKQTVNFLARYFIELNLTNVAKISGDMEKSARESSLKRFKGPANYLFISQDIAENVDFGQPTWLVEYAVPPALPEFVKLVKNIGAEKTLLMIDPEEAEFVERLNDGDLKFKELKFPANKIPDMMPKLVQLLDKVYDFYKSSWEGYREMITAYVRSKNPEFSTKRFQDEPKKLLNASASYGIKAPPKLPLTE